LLLLLGQLQGGTPGVLATEQGAKQVGRLLHAWKAARALSCSTTARQHWLPLLQGTSLVCCWLLSYRPEFSAYIFGIINFGLD
jgi:hypothetical protein